MANTNNPFGFRSFGHRDGSAPTMGLERKFILSSDTNLYFTGDPVAQSSATGFGGFIQPYFGSSVAPTFYGIFAGCEYYSPAAGKVTWNSFFPASVSSSSPVTAYIISDPEMTFLVQTSSAGYSSSMVGTNVPILASQSSLGNQTTGRSLVTVSSTQGMLAGSSLPFTLIDVYSNFGPPGANGTDNSSAYNIVVVGVNSAARHAGVTGVTT